MPWYNDLRPSGDPKKQMYSVIFQNYTDHAKVRTIDNLLKLRKHLKPIREKKQTNKNILLASWNIKQFGFLKQRIPDSYFYIAEILSSFDIIALQEVKKGLHDLNVIMKLLGKNWKYIMNDITEGDAGNDERFVYIYDTRRVGFSGLAGEVVLWKDLFKDGESVTQLKRTPYITGFRAGWKSFALINLHLQPGNDEQSRLFRLHEVQILMDAIKSKLKSDNLWTKNLILLGDFNLYNDNEEIVTVFNEHCFYESNLLSGLNTNTALTTPATYDRMYFRKDKFFEIPGKPTNRGGVIEIYDMVYGEEEYIHYKEEMEESKEDPSTLDAEVKYRKYFRDYWRKNQLSDHKPIWVEINIDSSDEFLKAKKQTAAVGQ